MIILFRFVGDIFIGLENFGEETKMIKIYQLSFSPLHIRRPSLSISVGNHLSCTIEATLENFWYIG